MKPLHSITPARTLVLACATVIEEMQPFLPQGMHHQVFDFGLHDRPEKLRQILQQAIDVLDGKYETIILGYGMCSQGIIGLRANKCRLVAPRVDDCIAIFLGSRTAYSAQTQAEPGTYYLTKGWIEVGDNPFSDYDRYVLRYGKERADRIYKLMMGNYKRLALVSTGHKDQEKYRQITREMADRFGLRYEEIEGSRELVRKMVSGPWDEDFVLIEPGETFCLQQFLRLDEGAV